MDIQHQQTMPGEASPSATVQPGAEPRRARRRVLAVVAAASISLAGLVAFVTARQSSEPGPSIERAASQTAIGDATTLSGPRISTTVAWLDGLAQGTMLPSDIATHLAGQRPKIARTITSAWGVLGASGDERDQVVALRWIDGLAAGLILPTDLTSRLPQRDPRLARVVATVWKGISALELRHTARPSQHRGIVKDA